MPRPNFIALIGRIRNTVRQKQKIALAHQPKCRAKIEPPKVATGTGKRRQTLVAKANLGLAGLISGTDFAFIK
jgi:hypothetical protein